MSVSLIQHYFGTKAAAAHRNARHPVERIGGHILGQLETLGPDVRPLHRTVPAVAQTFLPTDDERRAAMLLYLGFAGAALTDDEPAQSADVVRQRNEPARLHRYRADTGQRRPASWPKESTRPPRRSRFSRSSSDCRSPCFWSKRPCTATRPRCSTPTWSLLGADQRIVADGRSWLSDTRQRSGSGRPTRASPDTIGLVALSRLRTEPRVGPRSPVKSTATAMPPSRASCRPRSRTRSQLRDSSNRRRSPRRPNAPEVGVRTSTHDHMTVEPSGITEPVAAGRHRFADPCTSTWRVQVHRALKCQGLVSPRWQRRALVRRRHRHSIRSCGPKPPVSAA